jgi:hypothetical protein
VYRRAAPLATTTAAASPSIIATALPAWQLEEVTVEDAGVYLVDRLTGRVYVAGAVYEWPRPVGTLMVRSLGDARSSLGDARSSLGDARSSLGGAKSSLGDAKSSLGDARSSLGDARSSLGDARSSLGG